MFIPLVLIAVLYIIIYLKLKSQTIPGEQSANASQQRQQRERNVLKMTTAIVLGFASMYLLVYFRPLCVHHPMAQLWYPLRSLCVAFH